MKPPTPTRVAAALAAGLLAVAAPILPTPASAAPAQAAPAPVSTVPDPSVPGPLAVDAFDYDEGPVLVTDDETGLTYAAELSGNVHAPVGDGPYPLLVFQHGRHATCDFTVAEFLGYPCPETLITSNIDSFAGYDYLGELLASQGYVVVSLDANAINTFDSTGSNGMQERSQLLLETLDMVAAWADGSLDTTAGARVRGIVDLSAIGVMGHSRGGEGVATLIAENRNLPEPYALKAVFALAAVDFNDPVTDGVHFAALAPLCDGDVSNLQGTQAYDRSTYTDPDSPFARVQFVVRGTNHNFFNTVWTNDDNGGAATSDPVCGIRVDGSERLEPADQRRMGIATIATFLRRYVGDELAFDPLMTGEASIPSALCPTDPGSLDSPVTCDQYVGISYSGPAATRTMAFDPTDGAVATAEGLTTFAECDSDPAGNGLPACPDQNRSGNRQHTIEWDGPASLTLDLAVDGTLADLTGSEALTFRTLANDDARNVVDPATGTSSDFLVSIVTTGGTFTVPASTNGTFALTDKRSNRPQETMNDVRIPLAGTGIDLSAVQQVVFDFGVDGLPAAGSIQLAEVAFQGASVQAPPPVVPELPVGVAIPAALGGLALAGVLSARRRGARRPQVMPAA